MIPNAINTYCQLHFNLTFEEKIELLIQPYKYKNKKKLRGSLNHIVFMVACDMYDIVQQADMHVEDKHVYDAIDYRVEEYIFKTYGAYNNNIINDRLLNEINNILNGQTNKETEPKTTRKNYKTLNKKGSSSTGA